MESIYYTVSKIDGDYAVLRQEDTENDTILVARALLPDETDEGSRLRYDISTLSYSVL